MLVSWMTTNKCNLKCVHCYQDAEEATDKELSCEEGKKMIDEIARAGFKVMIFSGGEPLMRPDIYELVAHAASRGLRPVFGSSYVPRPAVPHEEVEHVLRDPHLKRLLRSADPLDELGDQGRNVPPVLAETSFDNNNLVIPATNDEARTNLNGPARDGKEALSNQFSDYFGQTEINKIETTYRFGEPLGAACGS